MRVRILLGVFAAMVVLGGCNWSTFRFDAAHTGASADDGIDHTTVTNLHLAWNAVLGNVNSAAASSPAVVDDTLYVGAQGADLLAYSATGAANCNSSHVCSPTWIGLTQGGVRSSPAVAKGVAYVGGDDGRLYAFDAHGVTGCSTGPRICNPLWTSAPIDNPIESSPVVAGGKVYVGGGNHQLLAYDAAGATNCSGSPKQCNPLFIGPTGGAVTSSPAVANNVVYVGSDDGKLYAYDAAGTTHCTSGLCAPLWTALTGGQVESSPAVANGVVYVGSDDGKLYAFDATGGAAHCSGTPVHCTPLWTAQTPNTVISSPAVANGTVFIETIAGGSFSGQLRAYDANGSTGCSGTPVTCQPLWTAFLGTYAETAPAVANGIVYTTSALGLFDITGEVSAFDAAGATNCSGSPKTCTALWSTTTGGDGVFGSPAIANGWLYASGESLYAYHP